MKGINSFESYLREDAFLEVVYCMRVVSPVNSVGVIFTEMQTVNF